jgi:hypothetical protein
MHGRLEKTRRRIAAHGLWGTIRIALGKSTAGKRRAAILKLESPEDRFTRIYATNHWNNPESRSGEGSSLQNTESLRAALPGVFARHDIERVLDAPCGDFNWMRLVVAESGIAYTGGDIVRPLIASNEARFGSERIAFLHLDITVDPLPPADLMVCRDCLFHLCYADIAAFLGNFLSSEIPLLLTSSHARPGAALTNKDIRTGDMRPIDLFSPPFGISPEGREIIDDRQVSSETERYMILLDRDAVQRAHRTLSEHLASG